MRQQFIDMLRQTKREGVENVIDYLDKAGFFEAPASVARHLSYDGGLLEHSLNVCKAARALAAQMVEMCPQIAPKLPDDSIVLASLLHDVCKANIYNKVQKWRKDAANRWEQYDAYDCDYSRFPVGHGEKSVIMLLRLGLDLKNDEILAIRWHMGAWNLPMQSYEDKNNISAAYDNCPLAVIVNAADGLATHIVETNKEKPAEKSADKQTEVLL